MRIETREVGDNARWTHAPEALAFLFLTVFLLGSAMAGPALGQSLRPSAASLDRQNREANRHGFTFLRAPSDIERQVEAGLLVPVSDTDSLFLKEVSFPYAQPEVRDFVELLGDKYRKACGDQLVVTSLTRARTRQPRNASERSVHPTGMALDLRRPWTRSCRSWLEQTLLTLEDSGVLEATLEANPAHYHLAVFPRQYRETGETLLETGKRSLYRVARGDTLWRIASRHSTSVTAVKQANGLRSNRIFIGQILKLP